MTTTRYRSAVLLFTLIALLGLAACGSEESTTNTEAAADTADSESESEAEQETEDGEDHADEDHADEDPAEEDHGDEEHDDDHGEDEHGDEEHKDDDHADEDHDDDHGDEDHDDHDDSSGGLGAHEHGAAELSVAWSDGTVIVDLVSPTFNIFGFEYEAETDEDKDIVADRTEALTAPGVLAINDEAGCELVDDVTTELEYEGSHAELTASWMFECSDPESISQLDAAMLFEQFPNFEDLDVQWASDSAQSSAELSPSSTVLRFE